MIHYHLLNFLGSDNENHLDFETYHQILPGKLFSGSLLFFGCQLVGSTEIGSVAQTSTVWVALICYWHFCVISSLLLTPAFGITSVDLVTALTDLLASPDITKVPTKFPKG